MIEQHLIKASKELSDRFDSLENPSYLDLYLILQNLITINELSDKSLFDEMYLHLYNSAKGFIEFKPDQPNSHFDGLNRDLSQTLEKLHLILSNEYKPK